MSHEHEDIDPFELELAALEQLPKERIRELASIGHASAIEELRKHNNRFHEHHDPDVMLRQIHRQHQNMISTQTPSVATWPRPWLKPAALVAFMLTLGFGVAFLRPEPSVEATSTAPDMAM